MSWLHLAGWCTSGSCLVLRSFTKDYLLATRPKQVPPPVLPHADSGRSLFDVSGSYALDVTSSSFRQNNGSVLAYAWLGTADSAQVVAQAGQMSMAHTLFEDNQS